MEKVVYSYDPQSGAFLGEDFAQESPLEPGEFLMPAHCVAYPPLKPAGENWPYWTGTEWELRDIGPTVFEMQDAARAMRTSLLAQTDWTQLPDSPLDENEKKKYAAYRQALRDIPEQEHFPHIIEWPEL